MSSDSDSDNYEGKNDKLLLGMNSLKVGAKLVSKCADLYSSFKSIGEDSDLSEYDSDNHSDLYSSDSDDNFFFRRRKKFS